VRPLESFVQWDLTEFPEFCFQIVYFTEEATELYQPVVKKIKVNPVKFYKEKSFSNTSFFQKKALMLAISNSIMAVEIDKLSKSDLEKVISQKEKSIVKPQKSAPRKRDGDLVEVDLHISELVDNTTGLSNREILEIQTERFKSEMELAIKEKVKRIVFIHGVGQGTLKTEVLKELNTKYKKYYFQDASFKEYGYGATMVILRKG
jgi:dsDNA-specific endonuclease/ATPase MutS2